MRCEALLLIIRHVIPATTTPVAAQEYTVLYFTRWFLILVFLLIVCSVLIEKFYEKSRVHSPAKTVISDLMSHRIGIHFMWGYTFVSYPLLIIEHVFSARAKPNTVLGYLARLSYLLALATKTLRMVSKTM